MKYLSSLIALSFALTAAHAQAQDAAPAQGTPTHPDQASPPATPAPDTDAPPAAAGQDAAAPAASDAATPASGSVSDAEVDQFAKATVSVQKINADSKLDAATKQTQMAAAVKASGLDPARYNEIGKAVAADSALKTKVQTAMGKYAG